MRRLALLTLLVALVPAGCARPRPDPLEVLNRPAFALNEANDAAVWDPVQRAYDRAVPLPVRDGLANFFRNLSVPGVLVNDLLQAKPVAAGQDLLRFAANLTWGVGGFVDAAGRFGLPQHDEDFGQTVGRWGVGPGPYVVFPVLGPSSAREAMTVTLDLALAPWNFVLGPLARDAPHRVQRRAIDAAHAAELGRRPDDDLDHYGFVRVAYRKDVARRTRDEPDVAPPTAAELDLPARGEGMTPWAELGRPVPVY